MEKLNDDFVFKREISREEENEIRTKMRIKEAKQEGISQGKIESAKNLLTLGIDEETIMKATGLSTSEIEKIKEENKNGRNK